MWEFNKPTLEEKLSKEKFFDGVRIYSEYINEDLTRRLNKVKEWCDKKLQEIEQKENKYVERI